MKNRVLVLCAAAAMLGAQGAVQAAGDAEAGQAKAGTCAGCHGAKGISMVPIYPNLAGQKEQYLVDSMKAYRDGGRDNAIMKPMKMMPLSTRVAKWNAGAAKGCKTSATARLRESKSASAGGSSTALSLTWNTAGKSARRLATSWRTRPSRVPPITKGR